MQVRRISLTIKETKPAPIAPANIPLSRLLLSQPFPVDIIPYTLPPTMRESPPQRAAREVECRLA
jgi:hypothetical protein